MNSMLSRQSAYNVAAHSVAMIVALHLVSSCPMAMADGPVRVACLGDGITAGVRVAAATQSYPARLQQFLGAGFRVKNFGRDDATMWRGGKPNAFQQLPNAADFGARIVIVMFGTDDTLDEGKHRAHVDAFEADAAALVDGLLGLPSRPQVILCTPPAYAVDAQGITAESKAIVEPRLSRLDEVCAAVRAVGARLDPSRTALVDLHAVTAGKPELSSPDGVHLTARGHELIAKALLPAVQAATERAAATPPLSDGSPLAPMLDLPGTGGDPSEIDFEKLPVLAGRHAVVSQGRPPWVFRLHSYLAFHHGKYWCMWSHGPVIEDKATQHVRYATSGDGLEWSEERVIVGPPAGKGERYIARGYWLRDGELIALASLDDTIKRHAAKTPWGPDLRLMGCTWDSVRQAWQEPTVIFADTLSNFPPAKLPGGEWAMTRRDHANNVTLLRGGVTSPSDWTVQPIVTARDPNRLFRPEEPEWWPLPDGRVLAAFRDNAGSKRLFRALSTDDGRTWTEPERTNFPDATSKFFGLRTSRGYYVLVSNASPRWRNPLCLSTSDDGITFTRISALAIPSQSPASGDREAKEGKVSGLQYPHVIEHDGNLLIAFSRDKMAIEVIQVSLDDVDILRSSR